MKVGALALDPAFDPEVTEYAAATSNATNAVSATAPDGATVAITVNGAEHANGQPATWQDGENTVSVVVTSGQDSKTYTVTVTKSE